MAVLSTLSQFFMGQISIRHCKHVGCLRATKNYEVSIPKFKLDFVQKYDCVLIFVSIGHTSINGPKHWHTVIFWDKVHIGVWESIPQDFFAALKCMVEEGNVNSREMCKFRESCSRLLIAFLMPKSLTPAHTAGTINAFSKSQLQPKLNFLYLSSRKTYLK